MAGLVNNSHQIQCVDDFQNLINTPLRGTINAIRWKRKLAGDFSEIVENLLLLDITATYLSDVPAGYLLDVTSRYLLDITPRYLSDITAK